MACWFARYFTAYFPDGLAARKSGFRSLAPGEQLRGGDAMSGVVGSGAGLAAARNRPAAGGAAAGRKRARGVSRWAEGSERRVVLGPERALARVGAMVVAQQLCGVVRLEHARGLVEPLEDGGGGLVGEFLGQRDEGTVVAVHGRSSSSAACTCWPSTWCLVSCAAAAREGKWRNTQSFVRLLRSPDGVLP